MNRANHIRSAGAALGRMRQGGVSLVEIMVVITIIAMVMGGVAVAVFPQLKKANCKTAYSTSKLIQQQIGLYRSDNNDCPKSLQDLHAGRYIDKDPIDPWGKPYNFKCPGEKNPDTGDVWSMGNDKQDGTQDDVRGWMTVEEQCNK